MDYRPFADKSFVELVAELYEQAFYYRLLEMLGKMRIRKTIITTLLLVFTLAVFTRPSLLMT